MDNIEKNCKQEIFVDDVAPKRNLILTAITVNIMQMSVGCSLAWTSPITEYLLSDDCHIRNITKENIGNLILILIIGTTIGPLLVWIAVDRIGRKMTMYLGAFIFMISWISLIFATSMMHLLFARFLSGVACIIVITVSPLLISEVAEPSVRGSLNSTIQLLTNMGYVVAYGLGPYISYITLNCIALSTVFIFMILMYFIRESPYYLLMKGEELRAKESLQWYRQRMEVEKEFNTIEDSIKSTIGVGVIKQFSILFGERKNRKAFFLSCMLFVFVEGTGMLAFTSFVEYIFIKLNLSYSDFGSLLIGVDKFIVGMMLPFVVQYFGLKKLLTVTPFILAFSLFSLATYILLHLYNYDLIMFHWIPLLSACVYIASLNLGLAPLCWVFMSEIFSPEIKSLGCTLVTIFNGICALLITLLFTIEMENIMKQLFIWGAITIFCGPFVHFFIPDTKHMTLEMIQTWLKLK